VASTQDCSIGFIPEVTYKTGLTPTRWVEYLDESLDWAKTIKQGKGLRVGGRVARSGRRVITSAMGKGDISLEATSKGLGLWWQALLGAGTSTLVSASTYQQLFTIGDVPTSLTIQKGLPELGGTVDAYTFLGCMIDSWEFDFPNDDIATCKATVNAGDLAVATAYAAPSYPTAPNLFHFSNVSYSSGALTAPTTTALAAGATPLTDIRGGSVVVNNNLNIRLNGGGAGRQSKPPLGLRTITGKLDVEYDSTTWRDSVIGDTPLNLIVTYTAGALGTGFETLQLVLPEIKLDGELAKTNGTDLIVQSCTFEGLDNLSAAQPIWVVCRTADSAL
jgi:hypothetical protein